ncbi:MAG: dihydroorotate dehydrogenase [Candidatus Omnitrophica bacterium]|nr:dihydroorotate dehydrogenase [Candidatus Omnitrophota bacterium]
MKKPNLETQIGRIKFKNPVLAASGTFGYAREFEKLTDLRRLGGIVTKTLTLKPRLGNAPTRIVETPSGMLNAIGLQNVGAERFIGEKLPYLRKLGVPIVASVMGYSVEEFVSVVEVLDSAKGIDGFELNLSCPNVSYGSRSKDGGVRMFAHEERLVAQVVRAVRKTTGKTVIAKLGPDVSDIGKMARAAEDAGADAVSLINTLVAMVIDVKKRRPVLANKTGGLSGPCIRPIAVRMVWEAAQRVSIPVIGIGGIMNAHDALEFLIAGASAIQVGTAGFVNPNACVEILEGIKRFMLDEKIRSAAELVGILNA